MTKLSEKVDKLNRKDQMGVKKDSIKEEEGGEIKDLIQKLSLGLQPDQVAKFYGHDQANAKIFLKNLEQSLSCIKDEMKLKAIIRGVEKGEAESWFSIMVNKFKTFQEFETLFLQHYWKVSEQQAVLDDLRHGKYRGTIDQSRASFAVIKISIIVTS